MEKRAKRLVLFTDAYPYGMAESFLHNEIAFTSAAFKEIIIYQKLQIYLYTNLKILTKIPHLKNIIDKTKASVLEAFVLRIHIIEKVLIIF